MATKYLLTPGPVQLPDDIRNAGACAMISHRSPAFSDLLVRIETKLKELLKTSGPVIILPSSGTGALEALSVNFLDKNSYFASVSCGTFGDRWRDIALRTAARGTFLDITAGQCAEPEAVARLAGGLERCDVLLLTHNETSTAVVNPIKEIIAALPKNSRPLIFIDGVSSVGAMECYPEEWGVDGIASASQKGLMSPPGLGFVWLSDRAWKYLENRRCASYYFDLQLHKKELEAKTTGNPYTPPISLYYALEGALGMILEKGAPKWFAGKKRFAAALAAGLETMGIELLVKDKRYRSPGVTAIKCSGSGAEQIRKNLRGMGIETATGQGTLKNELVRIAHYHDCGWPELSLLLGSVYAALNAADKGAADFLRNALEVWNNPA